MKNLILIFALLPLPFLTFSQTHKVLGSKAYCGKVFNYEFSQMSNGLCSFSIATIDNVESNSTHILNEFEQESFVTMCKGVITQLLKSDVPDCIKDKEIESFSSEIYFKIKANLNTDDDEPLTAYLKLKNTKIKCYYSKNAKITTKKDELVPLEQIFKVHNVAVEFEDGVIKNLFVDLIPLDQNGKLLVPFPVRFKNTIPISISSRNDNDEFSNYNIYISDYGAIKDKFKFEPLSGSTESLKLSNASSISESAGKKAGNICFVLPDLIDYVEVLETDKEDYSPKNCVVELNEGNSIQELKKIKRSKILSIKAFSDFVGINKEKPNGLIQFEASRKFFLSTKKLGYKKFYFGYINYIEPKAVFSKIEENNKFFNLVEKDLDRDFFEFNEKVFTVNAIDLLRYQNFAFDLDLNFWKINLPSIKSNLQINFSVGLTRMSTSDSIDIISKLPTAAQQRYFTDINSIRAGSSLIYEIKPDSRYGINLGYDLRNYRVLTEDYLITSNYNGLVNTFWVEAFLKTDANSKLFFRHRFSFSPPINDGNFVQIQLGYLSDLFKSSDK